MEVIVIESDAYYSLLNELYKHIQTKLEKSLADKKDNDDMYMEESEVMKLFGITNSKWFISFRSKMQIPCYKVGKSYIYKRSEIISFIEKHKAR